MILEMIPADEPVVCPADDTTPQHKGKHVYGKGCHHDACRSTHSHMVWVWGHKWVVLAINVKFPFASRPWALRCCARCIGQRVEPVRRPAAQNVHRLCCGNCCHTDPLVSREKVHSCGDGGYASHELARFCHRHRRHVTLVSRFHPQANLYEAPPDRRSKKGGRPEPRDRDCPSPPRPSNVPRPTLHRELVWRQDAARPTDLGEGHWYKSRRRPGSGPLGVSSRMLRARTGTNTSTAPTRAWRRSRIVSLYTGRWSIEVTFQEVRVHLAFPRRGTGRPKRAADSALSAGIVQRREPDLSPAHARERDATRVLRVYAKTEPTFSDAMTCVRRLVLGRGFSTVAQTCGCQKTILAITPPAAWTS